VSSFGPRNVRNNETPGDVFKHPYSSVNRRLLERAAARTPPHSCPPAHAMAATDPSWRTRKPAPSSSPKFSRLRFRIVSSLSTHLRVSIPPLHLKRSTKRSIQLPEIGKNSAVFLNRDPILAIVGLSAKKWAFERGRFASNPTRPRRGALGVTRAPHRNQRPKSPGIPQFWD
jgi:hypothetical protein